MTSSAAFDDQPGSSHTNGCVAGLEDAYFQQAGPSSQVNDVCVFDGSLSPGCSQSPGHEDDILEDVVGEFDSPLGNRRSLIQAPQPSQNSASTGSSSQSSVVPYDPVADPKHIVFQSKLDELLIGKKCNQEGCDGVTDPDSITFSNVGTALKVRL